MIYDRIYNSDLAKVFSRIFRSDGKFVSITFRKVDGSIRRMILKESSLARFVNPYASESGKQAAATRDRNHPNLIRVGEFLGMGAIDVQPRTVDLDKVLTIKCRGITEYVIRHQAGVQFMTKAA